MFESKSRTDDLLTEVPDKYYELVEDIIEKLERVYTEGLYQRDSNERKTGSGPAIMDHSLGGGAVSDISYGAPLIVNQIERV